MRQLATSSACERGDERVKSVETFLAVVAVMLLMSSAGEAQQPRYKEWQAQPQTGEMPELLDNLRKLTDQAAQSKAADPNFLNDLRKLTAAYQDRYAYAHQWPAKLAHDDFRDGDFTRGPAWTVVAGTWQVVTRGNASALHSAIATPQAAAPGAPAPATGQDVVTGMLGAIVRQQTGIGATGQQQPAPAQTATIVLPTAITNAFAIRLELASRDAGGRFDFGAYLGQHSDSSYRIAYAPAADSGLVLSRVTSQGTKLLGSATGKVSLEDDKPHVIDWRRDKAGKMTVALDGKTVIEATDTEIAKPLDGLVMVNGGGAYWITAVDISGTK